MSASVVCGMDLLAGSERVVAVAARLARAVQADVALVHVAADVERVDPALDPHVRPAALALARRLEARHLDARRRLEDARTALLHEGVPVDSVRVVDGRPAEALTAFARDHAAKFVVVGAGSKETLRARVLGSTAESLLRHSPCPVLVATGEGAVPDWTGREILVGVDGSAPSLAALRVADGIARRTGGHVHAICVTGDPPTICTVVEITRAAFPTPIGWTVVAGDPATEITATAAARSAALVVLGTSNRRGPARWVLGSVAPDVLRRADRPVMIVRAAEV